jgi:hypothetical protein
MDTIIPNEVRFDLDLQDLPARAVEVSSEALSLSGGYNRCYKNSTCCDVFGRNDTGMGGINALNYLCGYVCSTSNFPRWNGHGHNSARLGTTPLVVCGCCRG